ncbi:MAG TPA: hypothetical protein PLZ57_07370 [Pseudobdellovibrionaceae bacterium]|nr:hypothetical protein [Pseudobdellovibrionaceae bacterium]
MILLKLIGLCILIGLIPYIITAGLYVGGAILILTWILVTWLFNVPAMFVAAVLLTVMGLTELAWLALGAGIPISIVVQLIDQKLQWPKSLRAEGEATGASPSDAPTKAAASSPKRRRPIAPPF